MLLRLVFFIKPTSVSGIGYSKSVVHIYSYHGADDLRNQLEVVFLFLFF